MLQGGYPRIYDTRMPLNLFFSNYIDTYILMYAIWLTSADS